MQPYPYPYPGAPAGKAPGVLLVVLASMLSGVVGWYVARSRARKARALGHPTRRYWVAFWVTWPVMTALFLGLRFGLDTAPDVTSASVEQAIVADGAFTDGTQPMTATAARCVATDVDSHGAGDYRCLVQFADDSHEELSVIMDRDGHWLTT